MGRGGIITRRIWEKYALAHFRWSYFEVGLGDMRSANSLFGAVGFDGALTLHIAILNTQLITYKIREISFP